MADPAVIPIGGDGAYRVLGDVERAGTGRVRDAIEIEGEALVLLRELLTEVRALRMGFELATGIGLADPA